MSEHRLPNETPQKISMVSELPTPGKTSRMFFRLCILACSAFILWAGFAQLDIVSTADGEVIPSTRVKRVEHLEGGIVQEILVKEGDAVKQGQPLVSLEETFSGADLAEIQGRMNSLTGDLARLQAQAEGKEAPAFPDWFIKEHPTLAREAMELFEANKLLHQSEVAVQQSKINQFSEDIKGFTDSIKSTRHAHNLLSKEIAISRGLLKDKLTTEFKHLKLQREAAVLKGKLQGYESNLRKAKASLQEAKRKREALVHGYQKEARVELDKTRRDLEAYQQRLNKASDSQQRTTIRSPVDGLVQALSVVNVGEVVKPGETLMLVVPSEDKLVIEAHLPIRDIGYVQQGQSAKIKLASQDAGRFGAIEGVVKSVSPDTVTLDSRSFYNVRIETQSSYFENAGMQYRLYPGMLVMVYIHTGKRTILQYLLSPFMNTFSEALGER